MDGRGGVAWNLMCEEGGRRHRNCKHHAMSGIESWSRLGVKTDPLMLFDELTNF
jgi:hypothetical protein